MTVAFPALPVVGLMVKGAAGRGGRAAVHPRHGTLPAPTTSALASGGCLILCPFCLSASRRARLVVPSFLHSFVTVPAIAAAGTGRWALGAAGRGVCGAQPFPPPSLPSFIFLHALGRVEPSSVWFVGFFKIIYL